MQRYFIERYTIAAILTVFSAAALALDFEITPRIQTELNRQSAIVAGWAADPIVVKAVKEQNKIGPLPGMDNATWKNTRRIDPIVKKFQTNPAGEFLRAKLSASGGAITEAFLNGIKGEKVAFAEKTTSYIHVGQAKHDAPFSSRKPWQGKPEFDESSQTYAIQVSVPVLDGDVAIGSLVAGVNLSHLKKITQ